MGEVTLILVTLFRSLIPFTLFRWPLLGVFLCIMADASDVMLFEKFGSGPLTDSLYHNFDKFFDIYYLSFALLVAWKWKDPLGRKTAKILFGWRFTGFILFEFLSLIGIYSRPLFLLAPNIFENFFIAYLIILKFKPAFRFSSKSLWITLILVGIPKIIQEYIMHYAYVDQTWYFLRDHVFFFLYK